MSIHTRDAKETYTRTEQSTGQSDKGFLSESHLVKSDDGVFEVPLTEDRKCAIDILRVYELEPRHPNHLVLRDQA